MAAHYILKPYFYEYIPVKTVKEKSIKTFFQKSIKILSKSQNLQQINMFPVIKFIALKKKLLLPLKPMSYLQRYLKNKNIYCVYF